MRIAGIVGPLAWNALGGFVSSTQRDGGSLAQAVYRKSIVATEANVLSKAQNDLLTQTDPGTPCGALMRAYWQPVALADELLGDTPLPVRILGEDLVLFRQPDGTPALVGRFCPHRGMDLSYGRLEDGGLRCLYHGWLFAPDGRCLDQPCEPTGSTFKDRINHPGYPCLEAGGLILAYLGAGAPPPLQQIPFLHADPAHTYVMKRFHRCNYLQANDIDPSHLSFLHRFFEQGLARSESNQYTSKDPAPEAVLEETPFGMRAYATRRFGEDEQYVRITNFIMPNLQSYVGAPLVNPASEQPDPDQGYWLHWHVPVDDMHHWKYVIAYRADAPIERAHFVRMFAAEVTPDYLPIRTLENRFLQDRAEMQTRTYAGLGQSFQDQDRLATESQGPIYDRTREHLGVSDRPIIEQRKLMFQAIEAVAEGRTPAGISRDPQINPFAEMVTRSARLPRGADVRGFWREGAFST
jgi:phthalate 4,5-dioxygenase